MGDKKEIYNILLVSLDEGFCKKVSSVLSSEIGTYFVDYKELIEYDLINPKEILEKCGLEYLRKKERGVIANSCDYRDTVFSINYDLYKQNYDLFKYSLIVYIRLETNLIEEVVNKIEEENYDEFLKETSDIVIDMSKKDAKLAQQRICRKLGELLWIFVIRH